ncbi:DUF3422 domain-containing protein [Pseudomonas sp. DR48]|uniref:DUF3422 domain-containing protein n=1 Tax=Pseudomonas sp. DR48 TaxID=2871095 RepID=UPI0021BD3756|nr:DUF3422 domain-containing protein [Pseudomonas sp. DR48]
MAHLNDLLQARAQVELEAQNTQIVESLNQRAQTQIKIQKAVEGVSVIAITYYLLSLLKLIYQGGEALGLVLSSQVAVLICIPVTILVLWYSRHKINKVSDGASLSLSAGILGGTQPSSNMCPPGTRLLF